MNRSQTQPIEKTPVGSPETLIIEPDLDTEDDIINREETSWLSKRSHISNEEHNGHTEPNGTNLLSFLNLFLSLRGNLSRC